MKLRIPKELFFNEIEEIKNKGKTILDKKHQSPKKLISEINTWESLIYKTTKEGVENVPEKLLDKLKYLKRETFRSSNYVFGLYDDNADTYIERLKVEFSEKIISLEIVEGYLKTSDSINSETTIEINSIQDKILYVLNKLYLLYNDNFYSISMILKLNNIPFRQEEGFEIAENLAKRGYVIKEKDYQSNDLVKISLKGATYIERVNKKSRNTKREQDLNKKIDTVLNKLNELGYGQEIIFNEIEELRSLSKKLNKKTWAQLVKGKVVDLALTQVINKDTASFIYESLVDNTFKLLK